MLNIEAKDNIQKMKYIVDRFVKIEQYDVPKKIIVEPHVVERTPSNLYITFFSQLVSEDTVVVRKEPTIDHPIPDFAVYTQVEGEITKPNECKVDRANGLIYYHSSQFNSKVSVDYYAVGKGMLSSDLVYATFDSNGHVMDTIGTMIVKCKKELDRISVITSAEQLKEELQNYIEVIAELLRLLPGADKLSKELKKLIAEGNIVITSLDKSVKDAQKVLDQIKTSQNASVTILPSNWTRDGDKYRFVYNHSMNSVNVVINAYEVVANKLSSATIDYDINSPSSIAFYDNTNTKSYKINIGAGYYTGTVSDVSLINVDSMSDGASKVVMTREEREKIMTLEKKIEELTSQLKSISINK